MSMAKWGKAGTVTVLDALARSVETRPDAIYLDSCGEGQFSFAEIDRLSNRYAHGLAALGVGPGAPVCAMLDNSLDCVALFYAVLKLQALLVPLNTGLRGEFLRHQIDDSTATTMICEADYLDRVLAIRQDLPRLKNIVMRGGEPKALGLVQVRSLKSVLSDTVGGFANRPRPADICMLLYTSGTTGLSKACMISHSYIAHYVGDLEYSAVLNADERLYTCAPLFHIGALGMVLTSPFCGNRVVMEKRFSVSNFWPEIRRSGATVANIVGAMIALIAQGEETEDSKACHGQLRPVLGMPFTAELSRIWRDRFGMAYARNSGFGMSEACLILITPPHGELPEGSSGKASPDMDVRIFDDDGNECPDGTPGEMVLRPLAPNIMFSGYWNRPDETAKAFENLWFHTGDICRRDAQGFFTFVDRKKDYIRRRGENISTFELESVFMGHPALAAVAVHAVPSELTEDDVKLTAVLKPSASISERDLCEWAVERVPYFALPRYIEFRSELPYNASAKALKYKLREEGVTPATWDRDQAGFQAKKR